MKNPCITPFTHDVTFLRPSSVVPAASGMDFAQLEEMPMRLQGLLASALGCVVVVSGAVCPVRRGPAAPGTNCFWVECISTDGAGELRRIAQGVRPPGRGPADLLSLGLSAREAEILYWVAQGKTNPEIAVILGIARRTVATHVEHILAKLGVENRCAAARCASEVLYG
jgi:DNA-binding CsgD family transcriptional regulator